ncbi:unnamed protein product [Linum trigynum]|uniref:Uncharacterized protein n=1 Tax=Linum trigynum TaxID=586398 RepID=A0AAV2DLE1_9ROSI
MSSDPATDLWLGSMSFGVVAGGGLRSRSADDVAEDDEADIVWLDEDSDDEHSIDPGVNLDSKLLHLLLSHSFATNTSPSSLAPPSLAVAILHSPAVTSPSQRRRLPKTKPSAGIFHPFRQFVVVSLEFRPARLPSLSLRRPGKSSHSRFRLIPSHSISLFSPDLQLPSLPQK